MKLEEMGKHWKTGGRGNRKQWGRVQEFRERGEKRKLRRGENRKPWEKV